MLATCFHKLNSDPAWSKSPITLHNSVLNKVKRVGHVRATFLAPSVESLQLSCSSQTASMFRSRITGTERAIFSASQRQ